MRVALVVALYAVAALTLGGLFTDQLDADAVGALFGSAMLAWFGNELRTVQTTNRRRVNLVGAACASVVVIVNLIDLL